MKKLMMIAAFAAAFAGCSMFKVEYESNGAEVKYRIYKNEHWLKTDASGLRGNMTKDGGFEYSADGVSTSPSEEFNRTMQTYTTAFVQLAQIAAAAYNPSASAATKPATTAPAATTNATVMASPAATTNACPDCVKQ